jgi:hypothetical protein
MLRRTYTIILAITLLFSSFSFSQIYSGPAAGNAISGVMVSTNNFTSAFKGNELPGQQYVREYMDYLSEPSIYTGDMKVFTDYTYIEDVSSNLRSVNGIGTSFELQSFNSIPMTNAVPPDPHMAVGPNHVISMVNGRFHIYDRQGNLLKNISAAAWVGQVINHPVISDPQVIYDHYANRWVMLWLTINDAALQSSMTICYSDNENAIGTWYMYALNGSVNGTTNSNAFGDYPQLGYDDLGIYISSREFFFAGGLAGAKIKILNKSQLYSANGGPLTFTDLWNIRLLNGQQTDDLHPTISYDPGKNTAYFVIVPNSGNYYSFYKISNPITNPVLSGVNLAVPFFVTAPDAQQLGGGTPLSSGGGGSGMRNAPIIRDDSLYAVHHIRNTRDNISTSIKYFVIDVNTNSVVKQEEFGSTGFYYIYPSIAVDKDHNVAITYTRSGLTEYAGSYYSTRLVSDPQGFSPSKVMTEGKANYVNAPGGGANRWGDYLGAALDPVNQYNIWLYSEYAAATNQWGTWLTEIRMVPFQGVYGFVNISEYDFGRHEIGTESETLSVVLANYGFDDLIISDIPDSVGDFHLLNQLSYPIVLNTYDSLLLNFIYTPMVYGEQNINYPITNNSTNFTSIPFRGYGWKINAAVNNQLYGVSGLQNSGNFLSIDKANGQGANIGFSLFTDIKCISIKPDTNLVYAIRSNTIDSEILELNALDGDAYSYLTLPSLDLYSIAFDRNGLLYGVSTNKTIYKIDLVTGIFDSITSIPAMPVSVAFDPTTNDLWGTYKKLFSPKDLIIKIDLSTGDTTIIGRTGFGQNTIDICFDETGVLYGIKGTGTAFSDLFTIDKLTGVGTVVGSVGIKDITSIAYSYDNVVNSVDAVENIPLNYWLDQNYPNPFNPSTQIKFALPVNADVKITIYNLLGEVVKQLTAIDMNAGSHSVQWNADDDIGNKVSSGIYFYKLKANGVDGSEFSQVRKMILLK